MLVCGGVGIFGVVLGLLFGIERILVGFARCFVGGMVVVVRCVACVQGFGPLWYLPWVVGG